MVAKMGRDDRGGDDRDGDVGGCVTSGGSCAYSRTYIVLGDKKLRETLQASKRNRGPFSSAVIEKDTLSVDLPMTEVLVSTFSTFVRTRGRSLSLRNAAVFSCKVCRSLAPLV